MRTASGRSTPTSTASAACHKDKGLPCASTAAFTLAAHASVAGMVWASGIDFRFPGLGFIAFL
jgi:hypothetical protein